MTPIEFEGQNAILGKDQPEYLDLPVQIVEGPESQVISCWKLAPEELQEIIRTGVIWHSQLTFGKQYSPTILSAGPLANPQQPSSHTAANDPEK